MSQIPAPDRDYYGSDAPVRVISIALYTDACSALLRRVPIQLYDLYDSVVRAIPVGIQDSRAGEDAMHDAVNSVRAAVYEEKWCKPKE